MPSITVRPDPDPETSTFDGFLRCDNATYLTAHDSTTGCTDQSDVAVAVTFAQQNFAGGTTYRVFRSLAGFDTSSIPDTATITSATLSVYANGSAISDTDNDKVNIYAYDAPSSATAITNTDFNKTHFGATWSTEIDITSWNTGDGVANDFVLNSTGLTGISKTGVTWIGAKTSQDESSTTPTGGNSVVIYNADQAGTSTDPTLVVNYSGGGGGLALLGVQ
mgnify:CR=1 FL=1